MSRTVLHRLFSFDETRPMHLTVRQMEVIRAVNRHGSVGEAAGALGVSQPAVSLMLHECAQAAGFPFFVRKRGRLQATPETRDIMGELDRIFDGIAHVNRRLADMRTQTRGTVQIATVLTLAENLLAPTCTAFHQHWPQIQIEVITTDNATIADSVFQERVDFGLVLSPLIRDERVIDGRLTDLCEADLVCVMPDRHPLARLPVVRPQDLAPYPLISFNADLPLGALIEQSYRLAGIARRVAMKVTQTTMAYALVRANMGVAVVDPFYLPGGGIDNQGLITVPYAPRIAVKAQLLLPNNTALSRPARAFVTTLVETAQTLKKRLSANPGFP